jgi:predicted dehydrogenase
MKTNRRSFIKAAGVAGTGMMAAGLTSNCIGDQNKRSDPFAHTKEISEQEHEQLFNMCGYSAPKLDVVRIGIIGIGNRGITAVARLRLIEGVEIKALCDKYQERVDLAQKSLDDAGLPLAQGYAGNKEIWQNLVLRDDLDLVYICTPRGQHTKMAVMAMESGKHAATEVPALSTLEDGWQMVETSERTKKHCMMLENCCYDFFELLVLNMVRQGILGEIIHADGGYIHDHLEMNFKKNLTTGMWRLKESQNRNANLYPTHGFGPVCQVMNINRGDKMLHVTSTASNDFHMGKKATELAQKDVFYKEFDTNSYRGNINTSVIKTERGRTVMLQYDITSPRPYTRIQQISGTKGVSLKYPGPPRIALGGEWLDEGEMKEIWDKYTPEIVKRVGELAKRVGGHGGMDFIMDWRLIDCLRNGLPLDQDVYDAALWSSIGPLSELSVSNRSSSIDIPDFTCGSYKKNAPIDISYQITHSDYITGKVFDDAVSYSYYPIDMHNKYGVTPKHLTDGTIATIPLRSLLPKKSRNFLVAGRCISSDRLANSALRVQASCMGMGQAAGAAAVACKAPPDIWFLVPDELYTTGVSLPGFESAFSTKLKRQITNIFPTFRTKARMMFNNFIGCFCHLQRFPFMSGLSSCFPITFLSETARAWRPVLIFRRW